MSFEIPPLDVASPTLDGIRQALRTHKISIERDEKEFGCIVFCFGGVPCFFAIPPAQVYMPLDYSDDIALIDRAPFDDVFAAARSNVIAKLGPPSMEGIHAYSHRPPTHYYRYAVWALKHSRLALAQDEYDIQFGLDLSLRFIYRPGPIETRIYELGSPAPK